MLVLALTTAFGQDLPTAKEVLGNVDKNMVFDSRTATVKMTVEGRRTRTYEMLTFGRGADQSAIKYLAPARDKGTRMLRMGDELWMYLPTVERTQKISGHMLRQGMMGSDVSYEDMMATTQLEKDYTAVVKQVETVDGRSCYLVEMTAKDDTVTYPKRTSCVDTETWIPIQSKMYALSGMLLKTWTMTDVKAYENGRQFPGKMTVIDEVQQGSKTTLEFSELKFGVDLEDEVFSKRWLERG